MTREEMTRRGWDHLDFLLITGDAYVDHPSFGAALIGRVLEAEGFRVGIAAQPDCHDASGLKSMGRPKLAVLITAGNLDSMVANYTVWNKPRRDDAYSPGGEGGKRPDRATLVYTGLARQAFKNTVVILGGLEASLRRLTHYDYWSNKLRRSVLADSKADLLVYGMGENTIRVIAKRLAAGESPSTMTDIRGTVYASAELPSGAMILPSYEELSKNRRLFAESTGIQFRNTNPHTADILAEKTGERWMIQNPPAFPLTTGEMDTVYAMDYARTIHPAYKEVGVPSLNEVEFSITRNRGCYGGCAFCSLTFHQGRIVTTRSDDSVLAEAVLITKRPGFKGYIHDIGGPTANFTGPACEKQSRSGPCDNKNCLTPTPCPSLKADHEPLLKLLRKARALPGVKKVFLRSGLRFDYILAGNTVPFIEELCEHHVSGQLKVAPEHASDKVLKLMNKPPNRVFEKFRQLYEEANRKLGKKQFMIPYLIGSHPGSGLTEAIELALYLKKIKFVPDQVQDFYPTPGTVATCMFYTGTDPLTLKPVHIPDGEEKRLQRALLQFHKRENHDLVRKALIKAGRKDLIGTHPGALVQKAEQSRTFKR
jgi:uncharacterized radical SAM protein YgiQ